MASYLDLSTCVAAAAERWSYDSDFMELLCNMIEHAAETYQSPLRVNAEVVELTGLLDAICSKAMVVDQMKNTTIFSFLKESGMKSGKTQYFLPYTYKDFFKP